MHNILVSAYGCEPFVGSESGVGWYWVLEMAKYNKLHVITRLNNKEKIEPNIPEEIQENVTFYYYDAPLIFRKLKRKDKGLYFYYTIWQIGIIRIIKGILNNNHIDYTMHLSFGSFWMPTFLSFFNVPFIWGPLGGGDCIPKSFLKTLPLKDRIVQSARYLLVKTSFINPLVAHPAKRAVAILSRTDESAKTIPNKYQNKVKVILETAMSEDIFDIQKTKLRNKIELIYTGRLVPTKNVMSIVEAVNKVPNKYNIHLLIVGKGPDRGKIDTYIKQNKIENRITLIDSVPREEVLRKLANSDIYLFPSLHEGGSWALMEAMAIGLPAICLDCTGMHTITSEDSAIRIAPDGYEDFVEKTKEYICKLIDDEQYRLSIGDNARKRISSRFKWADKGVFMETLLDELDCMNRG